MDEAPRRRLFFALWPDAATRSALDAAALALAGKRIRRIPAANLHLTLAFVGPVDASVQACLEARAGDIRLPGFELDLDLGGHFPRARIQWLGASRIPDGLWDLVGALQRVFVSCEREPESRAFQAHVSIARNIMRALPVRPFAPVHWSVGSFCLVESVSSASGVQYQPLRCWQLESGLSSMG